MMINITITDNSIKITGHSRDNEPCARVTGVFDSIKYILGDKAEKVEQRQGHSFISFAKMTKAQKEIFSAIAQLYCDMHNVYHGTIALIDERKPEETGETEETENAESK